MTSRRGNRPDPTLQEYEDDIGRAKAAGDREEARRLEGEMNGYLFSLWDDDRARLTVALRARAIELGVSLPGRYHSGQPTEFWEQSQQDGEFYLTSEGIRESRQSIRDELRWKREVRSHWLAWFAGLTGLIGALTGFLAVLSAVVS